MTKHTPENDIYLMQAEYQSKIDNAIFDFRRELSKDSRNAKIKLVLQLGVVWFLVFYLLLVV